MRSSAKLTLSAWVKTEKLGDWQAIIWCGSHYENHYALKITPENKIRGLIWIDGPQTIFSETAIDSGVISMAYDSPTVIFEENQRYWK